MGATQKICRLNRKSLKILLEHQIYQSKQKISQKNCVSYLKSGKEPKICMWATRRNLQTQPTILKKLYEYK
jgi:hypothetical protein